MEVSNRKEKAGRWEGEYERCEGIRSYAVTVGSCQVRIKVNAFVGRFFNENLPKLATANDNGRLPTNYLLHRQTADAAAP